MKRNQDMLYLLQQSGSSVISWPKLLYLTRFRPVLRSKSNDWFLYYVQHWAEMCYAYSPQGPHKVFLMEKRHSKKSMYKIGPLFH